ncbi:MAG: hypothetical protein RL684_3276 [Pseudomonadota bacterium]|jgi:hypothetical protein
MRPFQCIALALWLATSPLASAAATDYGDWRVNRSADGATLDAYTVNETGSLLGEHCSVAEHSCNWVVVTAIRCSGEDEYPILGNTSSGAVPLQVQCQGATGDDSAQFRYGFTDWQQLEALMQDAARVGFAMPMAGDQFQVLRFSLTGRTAATAAVEAVALAGEGGAGDPGTADTPAVPGNGDVTL